MIRFILFDLLGITGLSSGLLNKIDDWKIGIIFLLSSLYLAGRIVMLALNAWDKYISIKERQRSMKRNL